MCLSLVRRCRPVYLRHGFTFSSEKDYLVNDGALLRQAIEADPEVLRKLEDALVIFGQYEKDMLSEIKRVSGVAYNSSSRPVTRIPSTFPQRHELELIGRCSELNIFNS